MPFDDDDVFKWAMGYVHTWVMATHGLCALEVPGKSHLSRYGQAPLTLTPLTPAMLQATRIHLLPNRASRCTHSLQPR